MLPTVLASECVVEREARLKEALPTALCLAICLTRGWEGLKDVVPPSPQRTPCWELEWGPAYILTHHPGPLKTILHLFLPFRDGCCRQGECFSHSEQGRRWQPAGHPCWGRPGVTECQAWSLQVGALEPQGLHQACPDARVLGRGLWIQLEIGKDCSLERRLHRQMQILFWQGESQSIDNEDSVLVIHVLSHAQIPREYSRRKIL